MATVGLHFGHDASATIMSADGLQRFINKERLSRTKHALGLSSEDVRSALSSSDPDALVGLSSTQNVPIFHDGALALDIEDARQMPARDFYQPLPSDHPYHAYSRWDNGLAEKSGVQVLESTFAYETAVNRGFNASYEALSMVRLLPGEGPGVKLHKNGTLRLDGQSYRARFYQHHLAHAWYAAYAMSPDRPALILTGDGGVGPSYFGGGVYFWTPPGKMVAVTPLDGWLGEFYTLVSMYLGFDEAGGPGKMMGLGPYGRPIHIDAGLIGTRLQVTRGNMLSMRAVIDRWLRSAGIDEKSLADWDRGAKAPPARIANVAASAQAILEVNQMKSLQAAVSIARRSGHEFDSILLCGGLFLNCPANSDMSGAADVPVHVPPATNDEGLSIGVAVAAYVDDHGKMPGGPANFADAVYLGSSPTREDVLVAARDGGWEQTADPESMIAETVSLLEGGAVVGMLSGKSEVGPRALGHRTIMADPRSGESWRRVNLVKRRETWRPLAPMVLHESSRAFFDEGPDFSPYMLFNYRATTKELPAITHYDHTSRLQHVVPETGLAYRVLRAWSDRGNGPALMNTSFNGPGVPIVETAADAFAEATAIGLDYILTDFGLYGRKQAESENDEVEAE